MKKINLCPPNCNITFGITIFAKPEMMGYTLDKEYKRLAYARKKAQELAQNNYCVMIRIKEYFTDCFCETSGPFEEYIDGRLVKEHKDFLTPVGRLAYGYTTLGKEGYRGFDIIEL